MRKIVRLTLTLFTVLSINSCNSGPKPIDYGNDGCHFCRMTIVDKIHASEIITDKGKVYKFDANECMLNFIEENKDMPIGELLTNYYEEPTKLMKTEEATFLISDNFPSPMGANLTAFKTKESANELLTEKGGKLYTWDEVKIQLKD